jgi:hypothetical protein
MNDFSDLVASNPTIDGCPFRHQLKELCHCRRFVWPFRYERAIWLPLCPAQCVNLQYWHVAPREDLEGSETVLQLLIENVEVKLLRWLLTRNFVVPEQNLVNFNSRNVGSWIKRPSIYCMNFYSMEIMPENNTEKRNLCLHYYSLCQNTHNNNRTWI